MGGYVLHLGGVEMCGGKGDVEVGVGVCDLWFVIWG